MKKLMTLALCLVAATAMAQPEPGDVGVFADPAGTQSTITVTPGVPFIVYVIGFELDGFVKGFEVQVDIPVGAFVLGTALNPPSGLNFGDVPGEFIVGTGGCFDGIPQYELVNLTMFWGAPVADTAICVGPTNPSSQGFNGGPGWLQCDNTQVPFGLAQNGEGRYPNGCLIVNPTMDGPVATESVSFGEVKGRF